MPDTIDIVEDEVIVTTSKPERDIRTRKQPQYVVIVMNDDEHTFEYVIQALSRVCGYSREKSFMLALQIHEAGRTPVWNGTMELAELKRDQIKEFGPDEFAPKTVTFPLGVYIEPLP